MGAAMRKNLLPVLTLIVFVLICALAIVALLQALQVIGPACHTTTVLVRR